MQFSLAFYFIFTVTLFSVDFLVGGNIIFAMYFYLFCVILHEMIPYLLGQNLPLQKVISPGKMSAAENV